MKKIQLANKTISASDPTYFIADIAASHDGSLDRAIELIHLAAQAGADAAKFQNFTADKIVSDFGFKQIGKLSHQALWSKPVSEVYRDASIPHAWTPILKSECDKAGIHYFSAAYDLEAIDMLDPHVPAFKIGSGDIDWLESLRHTASKGKPVLIATGASSMDEVKSAISELSKFNTQIVLMQCNTNYTASLENFKYINLNVLKTYASEFPDAVLGLSDHTPGHTTVLGAIALGARVVEKHFTDDANRDGPDHAFSMTPASWREMIDRARELESALGNGIKLIEQNELETRIIQRRAIRTVRDIEIGEIAKREDFSVLRPAPKEALAPAKLENVVGKRFKMALKANDLVALEHFDL